MKTYSYLLLLILLFFVACNNTPKTYLIEIPIATMGTWGTVKVVTDSAYDVASIENGIKTTLATVNNNFSTYIDTSLISEFNRLDSGGMAVNSSFVSLIQEAQTYQTQSQGAFNAQILPLIEYYGFGSTIGTQMIDSAKIDSLKAVINTSWSHAISIEGTNILKYKPMALDFSAFAKGYGVDEVARFIESVGITSYMVEIGGEVRTKGHNLEGEPWRLGIEVPNTEERSIYQVAQLSDMAMATSGNYRNFKTLPSGQKLVHIVNPSTGYPETSNLLSATIFAPTCMEADAYATACMVMGLERSVYFVDTMSSLEGFFIYSDDEGNLQHKASANAMRYLKP